MQNDLISRSALRKLYSGWIPQLTLPEDERDKKAIETCIAVLDDAPAVDAVELPVRPGRVVWILNHRFPAAIEEICIREDGVFAVWVEYDRSPELTEVWDDGEFDIKEIGKTVFLTVEEWEKAMHPCEHCFCGTYRSCDGCSYGERRADNEVSV